MVLQDVNMHIPKGSIYGLVGKNGAGKTTLIRIISGLQRANSGSYELLGVSDHDSNILQARRHMGALIEAPAIYPSLSARENLKAQFRLLNKHSFKRINGLLRMVGLENAGRKKAGAFSLGMRQRLAIAMALAGNPSFLVLDEPINGLDPQGIIEMRNLLVRLNQQYGITILISSHILDELSRIATHYGFLDHGHLVQETEAAGLENRGNSLTVLQVSKPDVLENLLAYNHIRFQKTGSDTFEILEPVGINALIRALDIDQCEVLRIHQPQENLENYFMSLLGSGADAVAAATGKAGKSAWMKGGN